MSAIGTTLRKYYTDAAAKRVDYENAWLSDLRQYKGIYDPDVASKMSPLRSKSFIRETRTKVRTIDARIMDLLFPANGEKNWSIEPTPEPTVAPDVYKRILEVIQQSLQEAGANRPPAPPEVKMAVKTFAEETCKKMSNVINDQLSEIKYRTIIRDVMHSGHLYGTGWLKGPLVDQVYEQRWELVQTANGVAWQLVKKKINRPYAEFRPIWNCYPDMSVTELDMCRFMCERHVMPRHKTLALAARSDFNKKLILDYVSNNPQGKADAQAFENMLYNLDNNQTRIPYSLAGSYEFIEYWGYISVEELLDIDAAKFEGLQAMKGVDLAGNIWLLGDEVVKASVEPVTGLVIPYYAYYFDKDETSIFGEGIASIMRDPQRLVNASIRAMVDNAAHCAGPQYEINTDLLDPGEDVTNIGAFRVWLRTGKDADVAGKEVVRVKTLQSYTPEFLNMYGLFSRLGDEITIIPRYLQGDARVSGAGRTASGLSMLMGQANVGLTDLVKMFDEGITKPFITGMYNWNMQFNEDNSIKGDMKVVPRGSTALIAKEIRAQQIQTFLQMTLNPTDASWTKRGNLLKKWAESTDIGGDEAVLTEEEHDVVVQQQIALAQQNQQAQEGAGYNQLESVIRQLEEGMKMMAEKIGGIEQFIAQAVQHTMSRRIMPPVNQGGENG